MTRHRILCPLLLGMLLLGCSRAPVPTGSTSDSRGTAGSQASSGGSASQPAAQPDLLSIHMIDATHGWGLAPGSLLQTADGGHAWATSLAVSGAVAGFYGAHDAWAATAPSPGKMVVYRSVDGGRAWSRTNLSSRSPLSPRFITFSSPTDGWMWASAGVSMSSEAGSLFSTTDGGADWTAIATTGTAAGAIPIAGIKHGFIFITGHEGWMANRPSLGGASWIYSTADGGRSWTGHGLPSALAIAPVVQVGLLLGIPGGVILGILEDQSGGRELLVAKTGPAGKWHVGQAIHSPSGDMAVAFADVLHGMATNGPQVYVTEDGGQTWTSYRPNRPLTAIAQLDLVSPSVGFALLRQGEGNLLLSTDNGGHTWKVP